MPGWAWVAGLVLGLVGCVNRPEFPILAVPRSAGSW